tara:strand:- start:89731 stop:90855 length:1125 start_codon:yes stop_codon:yes gene_type:complete
MALFVILLTLVLERLMRLIQLVTEEGTPVASAFELLWYLIPHYLGTALPAALFLALMISIRKLQQDSELTAIFSTGLSLEQIIRPVMALALLITILMAILVGFVQPYSRYAYHTAVWELTKSQILTNLRPGVFETLGPDITLRAETVSQGGKFFTGFFASAEQDGNKTIITAEEAIRVTESTNPDADFTLLLKNGKMVRESSTNNTAATISFSQFYWSPPLDKLKKYGLRGQSSREMTLPELFIGKPQQTLKAIPFLEVNTELHSRLVLILSVPVLALLAIPLALVGSGRTGRAYGMGLGIVILILYEKVLGFGEAFAALGSLSTWTGLWTPLTVLTVFTLILLVIWLDVTPYRHIMDKRHQRRHNKRMKKMNK